MPRRPALPKTYEDPVLGTFVHDSRFRGSYVQHVRHGDRQIEVILDCSHEDVTTDCLSASARVAGRFMPNLRQFIQKATDHAVATLLPLAKDWSRQLGTRALSEAQFRKQLKLDSITVHRDGGALWYDELEVFGYHSVMVRFGPRGGLRDASIEG